MTTAVECLHRLIFIVSMVAFRLFVKDLAPHDLPAFYTEIITAVTILALYMAALALTRIPSHPFLWWTRREPSERGP